MSPQNEMGGAPAPGAANDTIIVGLRAGEGADGNVCIRPMVGARARRPAREARALPSFAEFFWTQKFPERKVKIENKKAANLLFNID